MVNAIMTAQPGPDSGPFEMFLLWLSPDRDLAFKTYREIMRKIIKYFVRKSCDDPEELFCETRDRVIKIVSERAQYDNPEALFYSVATNVWREEGRKPKPEPLPVDDILPLPPQETDEKERKSRCLDVCLAKLQDSEHALITIYHQGQGLSKIEARRLLAVEHGGENNLRIKTFRIRTRLRACMDDCMNGPRVN
jgi:DNA-directed RNA polymerase specialized sigma24 family protein